MVTLDQAGPFVIIWDLDTTPMPTGNKPWEVYNLIRSKTNSQIIKWYFVSTAPNDNLRKSWVDFQIEVQFLYGDMLSMLSVLSKHLHYSKPFEVLVFSGLTSIHTMLSSCNRPISWITPDNTKYLPWFSSAFNMISFNDYFSQTSEPAKIKSTSPIAAPNEDSALLTSVFVEYFSENGIQVLSYEELKNQLAAKSPNPDSLIEIAVTNKMIRRLDSGAFILKSRAPYKSVIPKVVKYDALYEIFENQGASSLPFGNIIKFFELKNQASVPEIENFVFNAIDDSVLSVNSEKLTGETICVLIDNWRVIGKVSDAFDPSEFSFNENQLEDLKYIIVDHFETGSMNGISMSLNKYRSGIGKYRNSIYPLGFQNCSQFLAFAEHQNWVTRDEENAKLMISLKKPVAVKPTPPSTPQAGKISGNDARAAVAPSGPDAFYLKAYQAIYSVYKSQGTDCLPSKTVANLTKAHQGVIFKTGFTNLVGFFNHLKNMGYLIFNEDGTYAITQKLHDYFNPKPDNMNAVKGTPSKLEILKNENTRRPIVNAPEAAKPFNHTVRTPTSSKISGIRMNSQSSSTPNSSSSPINVDYGLILQNNPQYSHLYKIFQSAFKNKCMKKVPISVISTIYDRHIKESLNNLSLNDYLNEAVSLGILKIDKECIEVPNIHDLMKVSVENLNAPEKPNMTNTERPANPPAEEPRSAPQETAPLSRTGSEVDVPRYQNPNSSAAVPVTEQPAEAKPAIDIKKFTPMNEMRAQPPLINRPPTNYLTGNDVRSAPQPNFTPDYQMNGNSNNREFQGAMLDRFQDQNGRKQDARMMQESPSSNRETRLLDMSPPHSDPFYNPREPLKPKSAAEFPLIDLTDETVVCITADKENQQGHQNSPFELENEMRYQDRSKEKSSYVSDEVRQLVVIFKQLQSSSGTANLKYNQLKNLFSVFGNESKLQSLLKKAEDSNVIHFNAEDNTLSLAPGLDTENFNEE